MVAFTLCKPPMVTKAHQLLATAAVFGVLYAVAHIVTFAVTTAGPGWDSTSLSLDLTGWIAGTCFAVLCWKSSNLSSTSNKRSNQWICVWSILTFGVRILDTLMLFGAVKLSAVYKTPQGAVLWTNVVSDAIFGNLFVWCALAASIMILACPEDLSVEEPCLEDGAGIFVVLHDGQQRSLSKYGAAKCGNASEVAGVTGIRVTAHAKTDSGSQGQVQPGSSADSLPSLRGEASLLQSRCPSSLTRDTIFSQLSSTGQLRFCASSHLRRPLLQRAALDLLPFS
ncbi:unnamed protein product [Symbiodinium natans]|uniref:Uncharacterized protein n=1 Tax=Symbiodinium natans TaxID=878477 RepID=A0A812LG24_9DINO|nr:unnamed protein product [Symbiodinium natans]